MKRAILAAAVVLTVAAGCAPQPPARPASATPAAQAPGATPTPTAVHVIGEGENGETARITFRRGSRLVYEIRSSKNEGTEATGVATFTDADVLFYDPKGGALDAKAPEAVANEHAKTVTMKGGVRARTHSGSVLTCDTLIYRADTERLHAIGHVVLTTAAGSRAASSEATSDVRLEQVDFIGGTRS